MLLEPGHGKSVVLLVCLFVSIGWDFFVLNFGRQDVNSKQENLAYLEGSRN